MPNVIPTRVVPHAAVAADVNSLLIRREVRGMIDPWADIPAPSITTLERIPEQPAQQVETDTPRRYSLADVVYFSGMTCFATTAPVATSIGILGGPRLLELSPLLGALWLALGVVLLHWEERR